MLRACRTDRAGANGVGWQPWIFFLAVAVFAAGCVSPSPPTTVQSPQLVVILSVDQYRADYLTRFWDLYLPARSEGKPGGFRFLAQEGADFRNAAYDYASTFTCPGHASILTGSVPAIHGVISNSWYDRESSARVGNCTEPPSDGSGQRPQRGPSNLQATTLGDELKLASGGRSQVVSLAFKDYAAILMGGRLPDLVLWFDQSNGQWRNNSNYPQPLPEWVQQLNQQKWVDQEYSKQEWSPLLEEDVYRRLMLGQEARDLLLKTLPESDQTESPSGGWRFPYRFASAESGMLYSQVVRSGIGNAYVLHTAQKAVEAQSLGADEYPDLLAISLSSNDYVGHRFGPYSPEALDVQVRTDRLLAEFFQFLDRQVGLDRVIIALTADHGVAPVPEELASLGGSAGRPAFDELRHRFNQLIEQRFGNGAWIAGFNGNDLYLNRSLLRERRLKVEDVAGFAGQAISDLEEVHSVVARHDLLAGRRPGGPLAERISNGFHPQRSGDLIVVFRPNYFPDPGGLRTTHGSPFAYDTRVPILLRGPGVRSGIFLRPVAPTDIAPTLSQLLGVSYPSGTTGRPLEEALQLGRD